MDENLWPGGLVCDPHPFIWAEKKSFEPRPGLGGGPQREHHPVLQAYKKSDGTSDSSRFFVLFFLFIVFYIYIYIYIFVVSFLQIGPMVNQTLSVELCLQA